MSGFIGLPELVSRHAAERPRHEALICSGQRVSWAELDERTRRVAVALGEAGVSKGGLVGTCTTDPIAFIVMLVAVLRLRAVFVPLPARLAPESLRSIVADCRPRLIVTDEGRSPCDGPIEADVLGYSALSGSRAESGGWGKCMPGDSATVLYSSGTTSRPKGVVHTHGARFDSQRRFIERYAVTQTSVTLIATPLYTSMTWASLLPTLAAGGTSVVMSSFHPEAFWDLAGRCSAKLTLLVPTQYAMLLDCEPTRGGFDRFDCAIIGGAKADRPLIERLMTATRGKLIEQLGSTETDAISCLPSNSPREKWGSAGVPLRGVSVKILREDDREVPAGEVGEIAVHSSSLMTGYLGIDSDKAAFWQDPESGRRYYRMGDLGELDADGYLWVRGRAKELIIVGGYNVYPSDIEAVLLQHPGVHGAAVVGASSKVLGEVPVAFVEPAARHSVTESELCRWANARLSDKQRVYRVRIIDSLPVNASGKIVKAALRELARSAEC